MSQSASVKARYEHDPHGFGYGGASVIVGDGQIEFGMTHVSEQPLGIGVLETGEVKDIVRLLTYARREAVQQMINTHAMLTGHTHEWGLDPDVNGDTLDEWLSGEAPDTRESIEAESERRRQAIAHLLTWKSATLAVMTDKQMERVMALVQERA